MASLDVTSPAPVTGAGSSPTSGLRLGEASLTVTDLDRSVAFYQDVIGLAVHRQDVEEVTLGAGGEDLIHLVCVPGAGPARRGAGLYHVALLFPTRAELANVVMRVAVTRSPIQGASDHGTHEALYLGDPDGNGLELAADRPRGEWPRLEDMGGHGPAPLDLQALLDTVPGGSAPRRADDALRMGHVHLHGDDLAAAQHFHTEVLGFDVQMRLPTAAFMSADGYHHHLAVNTWNGPGPAAPVSSTVGLRHWTVGLRDEAALDELRARVQWPGRRSPTSTTEACWSPTRPASTSG